LILERIVVKKVVKISVTAIEIFDTVIGG
jgi:hypothetical protein